jgi:hypothetical protein
MEKKIIGAATFEVLHDSNIVFTKEDFMLNLNQVLRNHKVGLHEKSTHEIIKQLSAKDYIEQKDEYIIKTEKSLTHKESKQKKLLLLLLEEYCKEFDIDYIKSLFKNYIESDEQTPAIYNELISESFDLLIADLRQNKKILPKNEFKQVELIK